MAKYKKYYDHNFLIDFQKYNEKNKMYFSDFITPTQAHLDHNLTDMDLMELDNKFEIEGDYTNGYKFRAIKVML